MLILQEISAQWYFDFNMPVSTKPWSYKISSILTDFAYDLHYPQYLLFIVAVSIRGRKCGRYAFWVTGRKLLPHMVSESVFISKVKNGCFDDLKIKNWAI